MTREFKNEVLKLIVSTLDMISEEYGNVNSNGTDMGNVIYEIECWIDEDARADQTSGETPT